MFLVVARQDPLGRFDRADGVLVENNGCENEGSASCDGIRVGGLQKASVTTVTDTVAFESAPGCGGPSFRSVSMMQFDVWFGIGRDFVRQLVDVHYLLVIL